ncbi:MAG: monooxygenase, partial [Proteobacteria bacterium]|nr:monooxygenase [Pseudomonadota bacterium]
MDAAAHVTHWLRRFEEALAAGDRARLLSLFAEDSHWRDVLALTWHIDTVSGAAPVVDGLLAWAKRVRPTGFAIDPQRAPPRPAMRAGADAVEAIFRFETAQGRCSGVVRLVPVEAESPKAWTLLTALEELKGHEERNGRARRP